MWLVFIVIVALSIGFGWYFGHKKSVASTTESKYDSKLLNEYFLGLSYLINDQTDKAVDVFVKVLSVDSNTVEMHLVLGSLFRRKGEVDRAIKIHANIIARPQLTTEQRCNAILELAQDYLKAGVLDRAEKLFLDLIAINEADITSYKFLLSLYEKQKDWRQAISIAQKLNELNQENVDILIAHYYCEIADEAKNSGFVEQVEIYFKKALACDKKSVRASIGLGLLLENEGNYKIALKFYRKISEQDSYFLTEVTANMTSCYQALNYDPQELIDFLETVLDKNPQMTHLLLFILYYIQKTHGYNKVLEFINRKHTHDLHKNNLAYVTYLFYLYLLYLQPLITTTEATLSKSTVHSNFTSNLNLKVDGDMFSYLNFIYSLLYQINFHKANYKCVNCGLNTKQLYWQCPGCRRWSSIKPHMLQILSNDAIISEIT